jgi:ribosomal protein L37AE/L43A
MAINNAINNAMFNIMRKTKENFSKQPLPKTPCPQCGAMMQLQQVGQDGRMGQWHCQRCKFNQLIRLS